MSPSRPAPAGTPLPLPLLLLLLGATHAIDNGLGLRPPMAWRSWNLFGFDATQDLLLSVMDGLVARKRQVDGVPTSLCDLGFCEVGLDDGWEVCDNDSYHDGRGRPMVDVTKYPDLAALTRRAHELGLKASWYFNNCGCPEKTDARPLYEGDVNALVQKYHFDGVKLDGCGKMNNLDLWAKLLNDTGHPILVENCHWGEILPNATWCPWNFFRTSADIRANYGSIVSNLLTTERFATGLSHPGCWAYPDMLEIGVKHGIGGAADNGLSFTEARSHFGAWCIVSSPLTLSQDVRDDKVMDEIWPIISNKEAIAVNQAWAGKGGGVFLKSREAARSMDKWVPRWQFYFKPVGKGAVAVLIMNHDTEEATLRLDFEDVPDIECSKLCEVRDIWQHADLGVHDSLEVVLPSHDSSFIILRPPAHKHPESAAAILDTRLRGVGEKVEVQLRDVGVPRSAALPRVQGGWLAAGVAALLVGLAALRGSSARRQDASPALLLLE